MREKSLFDVDPLNAEEIELILRRAHAIPKALVQRSRIQRQQRAVTSSTNGNSALTKSR